MKQIDIGKWPFFPLVGISLSLSLAHAILQHWWPAVRDSTYGPRPAPAQLWIGLGVLLQMILISVAGTRICDDNEATGKKWKYATGEVLALGAWIVSCFVL